MLQLTISTLTNWISDTGIDPAFVDVVDNFLLAQGHHSMMECLGIQMPKYVCLAKVCDRIRYAGLVEERIEKMWLEIVRPVLKELGGQMSPQQWGINS